MRRSAVGVLNGNWKNKWRDPLMAGPVVDESLQSPRVNWRQRMQNALLALAGSDPAWMIWVEREIDAQWDIARQTRLIEARARATILKGHSFFGRQHIGSLLFSDSLMFREDGILKQS